MMLAGLAQNFLKGKLELSDVGKGMILEVKEMKGLGTTIDVILYDGKVKRNDNLVIGGSNPIITKIKTVLEPQPLKELRIEKQFKPIEEIEASAGAKIAAPNLENVIAGSPFIAVKNESDIEEAKKLVQKGVEEIQFSKQIEGIIIKADTLGSLEAMIKLLSEENMPIRKAEVGGIVRQDLIELQNVKDDTHKAVLIFNEKTKDGTIDLAKDMNVKIFENNVIYRLIDDYKKWCIEKKENEIKERLEKVSHPVKIKVLKNFIFHVKSPCIVGVEVMAGILKNGVKLKKLDGKYVGKVKGMQKEGQSVNEVKSGGKAAISMDEPTAGRTFNEGDILISDLSNRDKMILRQVYDKLSESEKSLLESI